MHPSPEAESGGPPNTARFGEFIGPGNLIHWVRHTAPFLFTDKARATAPPAASDRLIDLTAHPRGWHTILLHAERLLPPTETPFAPQREDYFALCLACHHATVATFVPTDVDTKIRGHVWKQRESHETRQRQFEASCNAFDWDLEGVSTRHVPFPGEPSARPISGHRGEMLSVLIGALGAFVKVGNTEAADEAATRIDAELKRQAKALRWILDKPRGNEITALKLANIMTHNCGDIDQGISWWPEAEPFAPYRERFARLSHENTRPYGGLYQIAARLYRETGIAAEGHRHYPLREVIILRQHADLLLPIGPFLDDWGELLATHPALTLKDRAEILGALVSGCKKVPGQNGYYRALAGMTATLERRIEAVADEMPSTARRLWKTAEMRQRVNVPRISFESELKKRVHSVLAAK